MYLLCTENQTNMTGYAVGHIQSMEQYDGLAEFLTKELNISGYDKWKMKQVGVDDAISWLLCESNSMYCWNEEYAIGAEEGNIGERSCNGNGEYGTQKWNCSENGFELIQDCYGDLSGWIDHLFDSNISNPLEALENFTLAIEGEESLSGEEIQTILSYLEFLFNLFLDDLEDADDPVSMSSDYLSNLTKVVDLVLNDFSAWLEIPSENRSLTFSSLTETMTKSGLELADALVSRFGVEFSFRDGRRNLLIEVWGKRKSDCSDPLVFPSEKGKTYATLPRGFQEQVQGESYAVVGVLYRLENLNALLPGNRTS
ncbi:unnamed protein product [Darwinula stevensoni]|uniref:Uncharacterized protein n=1 Tax=Darwinula stevensoni TaxID=69355 RepID=A0A7R9AFV3_9CRUS|nr:unnamed protein product [Darwinula stevensoni]CAG0903364.1 unnamed protein product [Darwinula stevensoni]